VAVTLTSSAVILKFKILTRSPIFSSMALLPPDPAATGVKEQDVTVCTPDHCFHAFDSLYCALTLSKPIPPKFADDK
jgi:hypothetical protein